MGGDEVSAGVLGTGECGPQAETLGRRRAVGEEVQRRPEPAGRPGGCARRQRLAGLPQHGDGAQVARPRGLRDVVRAPCRRCPAACGERRRRVRALRAAIRRGRTRRRRGGRAGGGSGSGAVPPWTGRGRAAAARPARRSPPARAGCAAAAASSGTNGSPATAAPSRARRVAGSSRASSPASAAATASGTEASSPESIASAGRAGDRRAVPDRRGCRRSRRTARRRTAPARPAHGPRPGSAHPVPAGSAGHRWSVPASRSGTCRGRMATARSTGAAGGRRSRAPIRSTDPGSAQCRSSSRRTSGVRAASTSRHRRTARWVR